MRANGRKIRQTQIRSARMICQKGHIKIFGGISVTTAREFYQGKCPTCGSPAVIKRDMVNV